jgi:hypothetical protein
LQPAIRRDSVVAAPLHSANTTVRFGGNGCCCRPTGNKPAKFRLLWIALLPEPAARNRLAARIEPRFLAGRGHARSENPQSDDGIARRGLAATKITPVHSGETMSPMVSWSASM